MKVFVADKVVGVTHLHDVVYIICEECSNMIRFNATTHQRLPGISVKDLRLPRDIAACERTSQVYVADSTFFGPAYIWRVPSNGAGIERWLLKSQFGEPRTLSVTSSRLLVMSNSSQLIQFNAAGAELKRIQLPDYMKQPRHAVESPTGTFIVSHRNFAEQDDHYHVSEVDSEGEPLRQFSCSPYLPPKSAAYIAVDSQGNIFVAGPYHILLLDAQLARCRLIIEKLPCFDPSHERVCYAEHSGQLMIAVDCDVQVFDVLCP